MILKENRAKLIAETDNNQELNHGRTAFGFTEDLNG